MSGACGGGQPEMRLIDRLAAPLDEIGELLLNQSVTGLAVLGRTGRLVRANRALNAMLGRDTAPGEQADSLFDSAGRDAIAAEIAATLQGRPPRPSIAKLNPGPSVELVSLPVCEPDGTISGVILQVSDITLRAQLEAQLAQSQKLQAVGQLAGGIAHDFNNLLTAIMAAADEMTARHPADADTLADVEQIRAGALRGAALVRQLLAFSRQQRLAPQAVSVNTAVDGLSALLRRLLGSRVRLMLDLEDQDCIVRADPAQLDQVLMNLAVNARDAMPSGGMLTLRTGHVTLFRPLVRGDEAIPPGRYAMIEVQDTGDGIPPEVLPRIFDPFFTTRREQGGTGLGLSTVHGIIRQSDGFLAVDSLVGEGTRMRIYLPRLEASASYAGDLSYSLPENALDNLAAPPGIAEPPGGSTLAGPENRPILFVDDDDQVRHFALRALTRRGWTVLSAASGEAALAMLAQPGVAASLRAVISDVVMPGIGGPALIAAIRRMRPGLPALLTTGFASGVEPLDGVVILEKPYAMADLLTLLDNFVQ